jgi:hypothetical protein
MTETLKRDEMIALLNRLGGERDEDVLEAARAAHARITGAGVSWDELLVSNDSGGRAPAVAEVEVEVEAEAEAEAEVEVEKKPEAPAAKAQSNAESLKLIEKMLAMKGISGSLRDELKSYKADIREGEFDKADARYLGALAKRLSKGG